jgi:hypothetical protein
MLGWMRHLACLPVGASYRLEVPGCHILTIYEKKDSVVSVGSQMKQYQVRNWGTRVEFCDTESLRKSLSASLSLSILQPSQCGQVRDVHYVNVICRPRVGIRECRHVIYVFIALQGQDPLCLCLLQGWRDSGYGRRASGRGPVLPSFFVKLRIFIALQVARRSALSACPRAMGSAGSRVWTALRSV